MKLIVAITGASGVNLGIKFLNMLPKEIEVHAIFSKSAKKALKLENNLNTKSIENENIHIYKESKIEACIASGSFGADAMIIVPCSMNTLAKCSIGMADNLITRAFAVMQKERKQTVICPRELPFSTISLEHMHKLSLHNTIVASPILGYYSKQQSLEDMENFIIGKLYDLLKIENNLYKRWK